MLIAQHATDLTIQLAFKSSAICQTGQVVSESSLFTNVEIGFELEQGSGPGEQQFQVSGIGNVAQGAHFRSSSEVFGPAANRSLHDYWNKLRERIGPDSLGQLITIQPRHHHVSDYQVKLKGFNGRERLLSVCGSGYLV